MKTFIATSRIEDKVGFRFRVISIVSILVLSLLGGFVWGLRNGPENAEALLAPPVMQTNWRPKLIFAPMGLALQPIGEKVEINGKPSESAVFQSQSDVKSVAAGVVSEWERQGYFASGIAYKDRGAAFGISSDSKIRTTLGIWRNADSGRTEGIISATKVQLPNSNSENISIAGITFPRGSKIGATFKSSENGETSWSSSLTTQGTIKDVSEWFVRENKYQGWKKGESPSQNFVQFNRKDEELTLLFNSVPPAQTGDEQVFVSIIKKERAAK